MTMSNQISYPSNQNQRGKFVPYRGRNYLQERKFEQATWKHERRAQIVVVLLSPDPLLREGAHCYTLSRLWGWGFCNIRRNISSSDRIRDFPQKLRRSLNDVLEEACISWCAVGANSIPCLCDIERPRIDHSLSRK